MTTLVLIAKEPLPGKVKTRLTPALTPEQAAELAAACIRDTLAAIAPVPATRRVLAFDGVRIPAGAEDYDLLSQADGTLDLRLGAIFDEIDGPILLIGMDTPQLTAEDLAPVFSAWPDDIDAWFGPASDGGFWALGMREPNGDLIRGVAMSEDSTGEQQLARLLAAGLRVGMLRELLDVDTIIDAHTVADDAPHGAFASTLAAFAQPALAGATRSVRS
jgi:glycosyltransferase A (GT-A) superfamily protein (DUF2064 family)